MRPPDETAAQLAEALEEAAPRDEVRRAVLGDVAELEQGPARGLLRRAFDAKWPVAALGAAAAAALLIAGPSLPPRTPSSNPPAMVAAPGSYDPYAPEDPTVVRARKADEEAWRSMAADVVAKHKGSWAVVGDGKLLAIGKTLALVAGTGADLPHRFVFEVGTEGDGEEFISSWYGTRFCGGGIHEALGTDWQAGASGFQLSKDGKTVRATLGDAFPRMVVRFDDPDPRPGERTSLTGEVFFGTVGPTMMLTPQDHDRLRLARYEIPGVVKVADLGTARRVLVRVRVPAIGADATIAALVPTMPYASLVNLARARNEWWQWGENIQPKMPFTVPGMGAPGSPAPATENETWILFGRDRILASGDSPSAALAGTVAPEDVDYHRFLMRVPREETLTLREVDFEKEPRSLVLNGTAHPGRPSKEGGPILVTAEVGRALRLELAESPRDLRLDLDAKPGESNGCGLRGGYAWLSEPAPGDPRQFVKRLVLVVWQDGC